ncbi:MAG: hypothetical protein LRY54_04165 [Alphaproteobacteria bacterium]|nr:hypothetical protein [Alphaproteobacteria bacterium]
MSQPPTDRRIELINHICTMLTNNVSAMTASACRQMREAARDDDDLKITADLTLVGCFATMAASLYNTLVLLSDQPADREYRPAIAVHGRSA